MAYHPWVEIDVLAILGLSEHAYAGCKAIKLRCAW